MGKRKIKRKPSSTTKVSEDENVTIPSYHGPEAWACLSGLGSLPSCSTKLDWYFKHHDISYPLINIKNITVLGVTISRLTLKERVVMCEWIKEHVDANSISGRLYSKFCQYSFPDYISSDDIKCHTYWNEFVDTWQDLELTQYKQWTDVTNYLKIIYTKYPLKDGASFNDLEEAFNLLTDNIKVLCSYICDMTSKKYKTSWQLKMPWTCIENDVLMDIITCSDLEVWFQEEIVNKEKYGGGITKGETLRVGNIRLYNMVFKLFDNIHYEYAEINVISKEHYDIKYETKIDKVYHLDDIHSCNKGYRYVQQLRNGIYNQHTARAICLC